MWVEARDDCVEISLLSAEKSNSAEVVFIGLGARKWASCR